MCLEWKPTADLRRSGATSRLAGVGAILSCCILNFNANGTIFRKPFYASQLQVPGLGGVNTVQEDMVRTNRGKRTNGENQSAGIPTNVPSSF